MSTLKRLGFCYKLSVFTVLKMFQFDSDILSLIEHLKIQYWLGLGIALIVIVYHYWTRIQPWPFPPYGRFDFLKLLPYIVLVLCYIIVKRLRDDREKKYQDFKKKSPGIQVDDPYTSECS